MISHGKPSELDAPASCSLFKMPTYSKLFFPSIFEHTHLSDVEQVSVYETLHEIGILFRMPVPCEEFLCKCETLANRVK
jgi:hypothetical protein